MSIHRVCSQGENDEILNTVCAARSMKGKGILYLKLNRFGDIPAVKYLKPQCFECSVNLRANLEVVVHFPVRFLQVMPLDVMSASLP